MKLHRMVPVVFLASAACAPPRAPRASVVREATPVTASFGRTWDAVIDIFAERNIPIRTMDRQSGFIAAEPSAIPTGTNESDAYAVSLADCGGTEAVAATGFGVATGKGTRNAATTATYNILVRGDSTAATVKVTARFVYQPMASSLSAVTCSSLGVWETEVEQDIKQRAEAPRASAK
jgi:hypothetical protein